MTQDGIFVISVFLIVISICIFIIFTPLHFMNRSIMIDRIKHFKKKYSDHSDKIHEISKKFKVEINIKTKGNLKIGYFFIDRKYDKILENFEKDKNNFSKLYYINNFENIISKNLEKLYEIKENINSIKRYKFSALFIKVERSLQSDIDKILLLDDVLEDKGFSEINIENLDKIYEKVKKSNSDSYKFNKKYRALSEKLKSFTKLIDRAESFYPKIRLSNIPINLRTSIYNRLNLILKRIHKSHITIKNLDEKYNEFQIQFEDFKNIFDINQEVSILYKRRGHMIDSFSEKIKDINVNIQRLRNFRGVLDEHKPFDLKIEFKYYIENMVKLVNNSYKSIEMGNYKNADVSRKRCGIIIKDLNDKLESIKKIHLLTIKSRDYFFDYSHELKSFGGSLFTSVKKDVNRYKLNKSITYKFKTIWDNIIELNENVRKKDIITLSQEVKSIYNSLLHLKDIIRKIPNKELNPLYLPEKTN